MAPPETKQGGNSHEPDADDGSHPCEKELNSSDSAAPPEVHHVDQEHKACDDHTEGKTFSRSLRFITGLEWGRIGCTGMGV